MSDDLFRAAIEPFQGLWQKLRIAGAAVLRDGHWIVMAIRITLSCSDGEPEFFINPASDFIAFSCNWVSSGEGLSQLANLLRSVTTKGTFAVSLAGKDLNIFLTLAHANADANVQPLQVRSFNSKRSR